MHCSVLCVCVCVCVCARACVHAVVMSSNGHIYLWTHVSCRAAAGHCACHGKDALGTRCMLHLLLLVHATTRVFLARCVWAQNVTQNDKECGQVIGGREIKRRAKGRACLGQQLGKPAVDQLDVHAARQHQVAALDVSVKDGRRVRAVHVVEHRGQRRQRLLNNTPKPANEKYIASLVKL